MYVYKAMPFFYNLVPFKIKDTKIIWHSFSFKYHMLDRYIPHCKTSFYSHSDLV